MRSITAFLLFLLISICFFGYGLVNHMDTALAGNWHPDKYIYIWNLAWWPYAITHHLNPFLPTLVWPPLGINLAKYTSMPGLALIGAPLTYLAGPQITYNLMMLLSPALAGWTAYLLARRVLNSPSYAFIPGYLFGFSDYMISHMQAHLNLVSPVFMIPLIPLILLRRLDNKINKLACVGLLTLLFTFLFLISSEVFVTTTIFGGMIYILSFFMFPEKRSALFDLSQSIVIAYLLTAIICSPYLYYFLTDQLMGHVGAGVTAASNDFLNLFVPDQLFLLSNNATQAISNLFTCNIMEWNSYLGVGLIVIMILFIKEFWHSKTARFFILSSIMLTLASFGPSLHIAGQKVLGFPWRFIFMLPIIHSIAPARVAMLASLPIALCIGWWMQRSAYRPKTRVILFIIAILFLLPTPNQTYRTTASIAPVPEFFKTDLYKQFIAPSDTVMMLPFLDKGAQIYWQTNSHFYFKMADGYLGAVPLAYRNDPVLPYFYKIIPDNKLTKNNLYHYFKQHSITKIIITDPSYQAWEVLLKQLDKHPKTIGGVIIYTIK